MAYSAKGRRLMEGGALALGLAGMALVAWLHRNHTDPVSVGLFRATLGLILFGLAMRAYNYMDEVQRQTLQKRWLFGSVMGIAAMLPLVVSLQTHQPWLDATIQFLFRHPATPSLYFSLGIAMPVMFQITSMLVLKLLDKFPRGSQP
jgi:hypothetical protein